MPLSKKAAPSGAPEWVLTYGDMMSLLLCFFILLAAFADYEAGGGQTKIMAAIESIREALDMPSLGSGKGEKPADLTSLLKQLEAILQRDRDKSRGDSDEKGIYGKEFRLRLIRDGMEITTGGPIMFEPFSAQLTEDGKETLVKIGDVLKGYRNKMDIRGHAAEEPRPADWTYDDAMKLSFARAEAVASELILRGLDPRTIRLVAVGANEPVAREVYDPAKRGMNRRVEIIVRESLIDDYVGQPAASNYSTSRPASPAAPSTGGPQSAPSP